MSQNLQKNNLTGAFLIKLHQVQACSFTKERLLHRYFSVNFKNTYFVEHLQRATSVLFYVSYLGRALLVKVDNFDLGLLAEYALNAGFDWVWYKSRNYLHISVIPDGMYDFFYPPCALHFAEIFHFRKIHSTYWLVHWRFLIKFLNFDQKFNRNILRLKFQTAQHAQLEIYSLIHTITKDNP